MPERGYESYSHEARPAAQSLLWLVLLVVVVLVAVGGLHHYFSDNARRDAEPTSPFRGIAQTPPEPRLQTRPSDEMHVFRRREEQALTTYGWIDREEGIVRIPIGRAMELTAKEQSP